MVRVGDGRPTDPDPYGVRRYPPTESPKAKVAVIRVTYHHPLLEVDSRRVLGYQAECDCGWAGERRVEISTARRDMRAHLEWWHRKRGKEA
jgi:hypothetical protein